MAGMTKAIEHGQNALAFKEIGRLATLAKYNSFKLKLAILKPNRFVTACLTFHNRMVTESKQEILDYSEVVLASFEAEVSMWQDFASRLTSTNLEVNGIRIAAMLPYSTMQEELYLSSQGDRLRKCFLFSQSSSGSLYSGVPLLGMRKPAYANLADAAARYVHELHVEHNQIQFEGTLVIALPAKRHIELAEWLPGEVRIVLKEDMPDHQLDALFWRGSGVLGSESVGNPTKECKLTVPGGTTMIGGHLLSPDGQPAQSFVLHSPYSFIGDAKSSLSQEQQVRADIAAGENDNREMKAFFNPNDNREMRDRVLHSAIAFANTSGGRIYVGIEDNGDLSGNSKLIKTIRNARTPTEAAQELTGQLRKLILESTRPVIEVTGTPVGLGTEWVVMLEVQSTRQIAATHTNDIFVRMGASNRRPSADWLEARSSRNGVSFLAR